MNFFQAQDKARRRTKLLVVFYLLAIVGISCGIYIAAELLISTQQSQASSNSSDIQFSFNPERFWLIISLTLSVIALGTLYRLMALSSGGKSVALSMQGVLVEQQSRDPNQRRLINVVSEMAIAAGIPRPEVYLIPDQSINAFAAGTKISNAVIGITQGALDYFDRDELQGVIAHEFSHIVNGDMRLNIRLTGLIFGLVMLGMLGTFLMFMPSRSSNKNAGWAVIVGIGLRLMGFIGEIFGLIIRAAVSRQREFLADASAVQYTRNPAGIIGALNKIANFSMPMQNKASGEYAHFFFTDAVSNMASKISSIFATHPPLNLRIQRLGGEFKPLAPDTAPRKRESSAKMTNISDIASSGLMNFVGEINQQAIDNASSINQQITPLLDQISLDGYSCRAVLYAIVLDRATQIRNKQLQRLVEYADVGVVKILKQIQPEIDSLTQTDFFAIVLEILPALNQLSDKQLKKFTDNLADVMQCDTDISAFDFSIYASVFHYLDHIPNDVAKASKYPNDQQISHFFKFLCSFDSKSSEKNYASIVAAINIQTLTEPVDMDQALIGLLKLSKLPFKMRREIAQLAIDCVNADGNIVAEELAMLRAIFYTFDMPLPALTI